MGLLLTLGDWRLVEGQGRGERGKGKGRMGKEMHPRLSTEGGIRPL